jgi:phosphatidylinositol kinase/protein kinase (PI-3  family)
MGEFLRSKSTGPASFYQIQRNYTVSTAFISSVGFIVGLGDRHTGNILIDQTSGEVMHVDFALLFNSGERLTVPEVCRLFQNPVNCSF